MIENNHLPFHVTLKYAYTSAAASGRYSFAPDASFSNLDFKKVKFRDFSTRHISSYNNKILQYPLYHKYRNDLVIES